MLPPLWVDIALVVVFTPTLCLYIWILWNSRRKKHDGEVWCFDCCFNDGRTVVISAEDTHEHMQKHVAIGGNEQQERLW